MLIRAGMLPVDAAARFAGKTALTTAEGSQTFAELDASANRVATGLAALGLGEGERVGVLSHNRAEVVHAWLGCERAGIVRVVMHSHFDMGTHAELLEQVDARGLIFDVRFAGAVEAHRDRLGDVLLIAVGEDPPSWAVPWADVLAAGSPVAEPLDVDEDSLAFIQPTSGTTGSPKPWTVSHRSWAAVVDQNLHHVDTFAPGLEPVGPSDVVLHAHALQWATGFQLLYPYLVRGARTVLVDDSAFDPAHVLDVIVSEGVTGLLLPAPMLDPILDLVERRGGVEHCLRRLVVFFATPEVLERTTALLGPVWCHGFGSTEQGAVTTRLLASEVAEDPRRIASVGRPASPFFEVAIVDDAGRRVPTGRLGEIVVRSAMSIGHYWGMPDRTAEAFLLGDWFRPADIGHLDEDGFLYYVDRAADSIPTASGSVYPHAVEAAVLKHAAVANCGVVGLGDDRVVAAVVLKDGFTDTHALREDIDRTAAPGLFPHERPEIIVVDELPCVLGGAKVQRAVLRERLAAEA
ncbi:class I adenylate-forming enzyme family protein [Actinomadura sp. WMMA1423]|uniref:class I adenylate-forming enzyme family protein n=1 Tax=Actinomadura sp. WMMA1423 TaxID=2591108 RepID=UPI001146A840|nr:class I adenylate-forming enzyme family protein [Actinomadura sp. WMMA1423]